MEEHFSGEPICKYESSLSLFLSLSGSNPSARSSTIRFSPPTCLCTSLLHLAAAATVQDIFVLGKATRAAVGESLRVGGHNNLQSTRIIHQAKYDRVRSSRLTKSGKTKPACLFRLPRGRNRARKARRIINRRGGKKVHGVWSLVSLHRGGV